MLQAAARSLLKKKFPEMFKGIDAERDQKVSEIDKQIDELKSELKSK